MKNFKTFIEAVDKHMVDELKLFIDNDGQLYKQRLIPIVKNIQKLSLIHISEPTRPY